MSKPSSGHFSGTAGCDHSKIITQTSDNRNIIASKGLDTREHPTKYKQMSSKKLKILREKVRTRTITKEEYKRLNWQSRFTTRRNKAVKDFWIVERIRIIKRLPTTRNWSAEQRKAILSGKRPKYNGWTMESHHTYSVSKYPHLANRHELIYPATHYEHIYGFHGGNPKSSLPGVPIKKIKEF
jgi:hypothetical protein